MLQLPWHQGRALYYLEIFQTQEIGLTSITESIALLKRNNTLLKRNNISFPRNPLRTHVDSISQIFNDVILQVYDKNMVNIICFEKILAEKIAIFKPNLTLYTDESFQNRATSFALVKRSAAGYEVIRELQLSDNTVIFIAEIVAIIPAISYSRSMNQSSVIFTYSLCTTTALRKKKERNGLYNKILQQKLEPILIHWIPPHIEMQGNEHADKAAIKTINIIQFDKAPCFPKAITNPFRISRKEQNPMSVRPRYNLTWTRNHWTVSLIVRMDSF